LFVLPFICLSVCAFDVRDVRDIQKTVVLLKQWSEHCRRQGVHDAVRVQTAASALLVAAAAAQALLWRLEFADAPHEIIAVILPVALQTMQDAGFDIEAAEPDDRLRALNYLRYGMSTSFS